MSFFPVKTVRGCCFSSCSRALVQFPKTHSFPAWRFILLHRVTRAILPCERNSRASPPCIRICLYSPGYPSSSPAASVLGGSGGGAGASLFSYACCLSGSNLVLRHLLPRAQKPFSRGALVFCFSSFTASLFHISVNTKVK